MQKLRCSQLITVHTVGSRRKIANANWLLAWRTNIFQLSTSRKKESMRKYSLLFNVFHGSHIKVCLKTLYKIQIHMVINGNTVVPKVLHNIVNLIGIMLGKIIHNSLNGYIFQTNGNHLKGIGNLQTNGEDLSNGLKMLDTHLYHLQQIHLH